MANWKQRCRVVIVALSFFNFCWLNHIMRWSPIYKIGNELALPLKILNLRIIKTLKKTILGLIIIFSARSKGFGQEEDARSDS